MLQAYFSFDAELNHFLPGSKKYQTFPFTFKEKPSIKDAIESLGVPHPEVKYILVNDRFVDFSYLVRDRDRVRVLPVSIVPSLPGALDLQPPLIQPPHFILDVHLGKLASELRMLGFDTLYRNDYADPELAEISATQKRVVLTRDKGVLMRGIVTYGYYVRSTNPVKQLPEVMHRFNLFDLVRPFKRCIKCNNFLESIEKHLIVDLIPEKTKQEINEFHRCSSCFQVYWKGNHYQRMVDFIGQVLKNK